MIRIYVQNKPLFLIDQINGEVENYLRHPRTLFLHEINALRINDMLKRLEESTVCAGVLQHPDLDELFQAFRSCLTLVKAAGGLVYTPEGEVLLIFRRGKWDLPKGKLDEGENLEDCATREIAEETGFTGTKILKPLLITYHTYRERGNHILKESHWFLMSGNSSPLQPQTEEDIEKCAWVPVSALPAYRNNMHASIIDVIDEGIKWTGQGN